MSAVVTVQLVEDRKTVDFEARWEHLHLEVPARKGMRVLVGTTRL